MKKNQLLIFLLAVSVIVLSSCGTSRFGKSHYKNRDWVWVGSDAKEATVNESIQKEDAVIHDGKEETIVKAEKKSNLKPETKNEIVPFSEMRNEIIDEKAINSEIESNHSLDDNIVNESETVPSIDYSSEDVSSIEQKNGSDGSWTSLLLVAVLIALIIVAIAVLDNVLGGIIGLILLIFIILLLLRYFGVI